MKKINILLALIAFVSNSWAMKNYEYNDNKPVFQKKCIYFNGMSNSCRNGKNCKFSHDKVEYSKSKFQKKCIYFNGMSDSCRNGKNCKFSHDKVNYPDQNSSYTNTKPIHTKPKKITSVYSSFRANISTLSENYSLGDQPGGTHKYNDVYRYEYIDDDNSDDEGYNNFMQRNQGYIWGKAGYEMDWTDEKEERWLEDHKDYD